MDESKGPGSMPAGEPADTPVAGGVADAAVAHEAVPAVIRAEPRSVAGVVIWLLVLVVCYAGVVVTAALAEAHRRVSHEEKGLFAMACSPTMGEGVSCDQVLQSRWAYQWIPTSLAVARQWL
ncbi:MAG TPA: hypothetical protein PLC79_08915, partial [Phycisphaerae bacterium]|nr:hypothetical protein [Phycisphaerae bacterium]